MFKFLAQPYPRSEPNARRWLLTSAGAGLFVALFLIVFQPFGATEYNDPRKPLQLGGFGVVTFVCLGLVGLILPVVFRSWFAERTWTVGKEILWHIVIIISIAFGNMLYSGWVFGGGYGNILPWLGITAAVGIIPSTVITLLNYTRLLRKNATCPSRMVS